MDDLPFSEHLRAELGSPTAAVRLDSSPRSRVWRVELAGTPAVVKQLVPDPEAADRYTREVTALQLASRATPPVAPALLGTDPQQHILVLEHLEHHHPAEDWLIDYATTLARLHATVAPEANLSTWPAPTPADAEAFLRLAHHLEVTVTPQAQTELTALLERLRTLPVTALLHGDPCPGNDIHTPQGIRFIDFEQASLGNGLVELAYLRIGFPTCWCATAPPEPLRQAAETAYRTTWQSTTGTPLTATTTDACAGWLLRGDALVPRAQRGTTDHLAEATTRDWLWGTATARQRLTHRLAVVSKLTADDDALVGVSLLTSTMHASALAHWPTLEPLPTRRP
ncbi:aminoglycoside phosphotransferase family protein [Actinokineospora sp. PR83]|uniref:aminoglycoside phosphotransferase family protein n=1 Tax=Actinokineospora sp. PR83 TaxID=2884908 RepID=UPI0027150280|nr:aminoglycoside phosphotransferase family protein [Actinokineospora sp. PR83]